MTQLHKPGEYATIKVEVPATHLPSNLLDPHLFTGDEWIKGLYPSPTGRLSYKILYLDSEALAQQYMAYLHTVFSRRAYANHYTMKVVVTHTSEKVIATKRKLIHSARVRNTLAAAGIAT